MDEIDEVLGMSKLVLVVILELELVMYFVITFLSRNPDWLESNSTPNTHVANSTILVASMWVLAHVIEKNR